MAKNWAQESKRLREELEQRHAAELRDAQAAVIDSFKGLKGQILEGLQ